MKPKETQEMPSYTAWAVYYPLTPYLDERIYDTRAALIGGFNAEAAFYGQYTWGQRRRQGLVRAVKVRVTMIG